MAKIRIDYDGIGQQASAMNSVLSEYEALNARLKTLSSAIQDSWEGEAAQAYAEMMQKYSMQGQNLSLVFQAFKKHMNETADRFSSVDQECANLINNSF